MNETKNTTSHRNGGIALDETHLIPIEEIDYRNIPIYPGAMTTAQRTRHIIRKLTVTAGAIATGTTATAILIYLLFL